MRKLIISHRGNLSGRKNETENSPKQIDKALNLGFNVEVDVWFDNNSYYLGHNFPEYKISFNYLLNNKLWCHAKNEKTFYLLLKEHNIHSFFHQQDDCALTSKGYIWHFPKKELVSKHKSVAVLPELTDKSYSLNNAFAICTDYPIDFNKSLDFRV